MITNRHIGPALIAATLAVGLLVGGCGRESKARLDVSGTVRSEERVAAAPRIDWPRAIPATGTLATRAGSVSRGGPAVSGRVASVTVEVGDAVEAGQVVCMLDDRLLSLDVSRAQADLRRASALFDSIGQHRTDLRSKRSDLRDTRRKLQKGLGELTRQRLALETQLASLKKLLSAPRPVPPAPPATVTPMPPAGSTRPPDPRALVAKMEAALRLMRDKESQLRAALSKLGGADAKIADAFGALDDAEAMAAAGIQAREAALGLARSRREQAIVRAPASGVVVGVVSPGSVVFVGAPLARLRPSNATLVDTYVTAEQARGIAAGSAAEVRSDSIPERVFAGKVTAVGDTYGFPPTRFATNVIHMTRAFRVTVTLEDAGPPPGTPVDLSIETAGQRG